MKATLFAVVLSLFFISFPVLAVEENAENKTPPPAQHVNKINLNKADVQTLVGSFKGIGQKRATAIVSYREAHGNFKSVTDLAGVRGIGNAFVNKNLLQLQNVFEIK